ncbi:DNA repair exonuclease [Virgibacillus proomii]|uniref:DNA repair exonuclease n=1 Tax=Virgibacillus proomii TaxID=84407 RepID=UPI000986A2C1|nr:DNA repair exonuclease [Virgibacillus proomii]
MTKEITFIHAADLHLDSPFKGLATAPESIFREIRESTFTALDELVRMAIDKQVDFVLLVGDLFDNEQQSLKAQIRLKRAFERLQQHHITVFLSYGNHDYIKANPHPVTYPNNVVIFQNETVSSVTYEKNGEVLARIYGFSYENRAVIKNKTAEYQITDPSVPYHIAMLHGSVQSNTDHDTYAPFKITELANKDFDYWALGHIHQRQILKEYPPIVYSGNTQGRNRKEVGEKGCYLVRLTKDKSRLTFLPLQAIQITSIVVDVSLCQSVFDIEGHLLQQLQQINGSIPQLIEVLLVSADKRLLDWDSEGRIEEVVDIVNETLIQSSNWQYLFRHTIQLKAATFDPTLYEGEHFIGELLREAEQQSIQPFITDLYQHKRARKFLERIENEDEIKEAAKELIVHELLKE